jgi:hypothetical protein
VIIFRSLPDESFNNFYSKESYNNTASCSAILGFANHQLALNAKKCSGVGTVNIWGRNIKVLWATSEHVNKLKLDKNGLNNILFHNVDPDMDPEDFGELLCSVVEPHEIISIRPMLTDWLVQLSDSEAAFKVQSQFHAKRIQNRTVFAEGISDGSLRQLNSFIDFDFEVRCFCIANYWDPPIFIYGHIMPMTKTQICAIIIKDNRKNRFTTLIFEMNFNGLVEIHSRVCELLMIILDEFKELPKKNIVVKCINERFAEVGKIRKCFLLIFSKVSFFSQLDSSLICPNQS